MKIKTISSKEAAPDMVVADDIFSFSGQLIIPKGTVLTNRSITRLKFYSITDIKIVIEEESPEEVAEQPVEETVEAVPEPAHEERAVQRESRNFSEAIRNTPEYQKFNESVLQSAEVLQNSLTDFLSKTDEEVDANQLLDQTKDTIAASRNPLHTFHMLQSMREYDDATFIHSLNVSIICNAFGHWLGMNEEDIDTLTLAGLLHDVGKMKVPDSIIKKPSSLSEAEFAMVKLHPRRGYNILKPLRIDQRIKNAALMHHERCDGSGYPSGLKADEIDDFAKIVAIADIYDAMTSARVYRGPLCPFEVLTVFETEGYLHFDSHFQLVFLENIVNSYMNNTVRLSDGRVGEIIMINKLSLSRPVVKVGDEFVDLSKEKDLTIEAML